MDTGTLRFGALDYTMFVGMLTLSAAIGLYFGFISKQKQNNTDEYLKGSKSMKPIPVAISLAATHISSISIIGLAAEAYQYGTQYWALSFPLIVSGVIFYIFFLPVFYELTGLTIYEYLEKRFDRRQRVFTSGLYTLQALLFLPIMVYAPALALSQVSGVNLHYATPVICFVCIFYTTFGGVRAVVWADTLQFVTMIGAITFIAIYGTYNVAGFQNVSEVLDRSGRLILYDSNPDPTLRQSIWMILFGMLPTSNLVNPECIQRLQSLPKYSDARKTLIWAVFGMFGFRLVILYCGTLIYVRYGTCDPYTLGFIQKFDQLFPYYVMDIARNLPGLSGIFIAGVFAAGLSSMSTTLNCLAGVVYSDFIKRWIPNASEKTASNIMKTTVFVIGLINIGFVFIIEKLGSLITITFSLTGLTVGPIFGSFVLGIFFPKANRHGVFWGSLSAIFTLFVITFGAQWYTMQGKIKFETLPFYTDGCEELGFNNYSTYKGFVGNPNSTVHVYYANADVDSVPYIFRIGFMYYGCIGMMITVAVGYIISVWTGGCEDLDDRLLTPIIRERYRKELSKQKEEESNKMYQLATPMIRACD